MRRSRVPVLEKRSSGSNTKYNSSLRGTTSTGPKITKKNFSVNMVSTRSGTESKTREDAEEPNPKPIEFSPIDNVEDAIGNTEETVKEDSQVK